MCFIGTCLIIDNYKMLIVVLTLFNIGKTPMGAKVCSYFCTLPPFSVEDCVLIHILYNKCSFIFYIILFLKS